MKLWGGVCICALACLLASAPALAAQAQQGKPKFERHGRSLQLWLKVNASNGYEGRITTRGHKQVTLTLSKGKTVVEARTTGRVSNEGIEADFGELGRISVRFSGEPARSGRGDGERNCRGRRSIVEFGRFHGAIRFRGENDFVQIDSKRAVGFVERNYPRLCRSDRGLNALIKIFEDLFKGVRLTALEARGRVDGANVFFQATAVDLRSLLGPEAGLAYSFSARSVERVDGVRLTRAVSTEGGGGSFLFKHSDKTPHAATITPPRPFSGSAEYAKEQGLRATWIGPLAARLPGAGAVAMTGPGFRAGLCRLTLGAVADGRGCLAGPDRAEAQSLSTLDAAPLLELIDRHPRSSYEAGRLQILWPNAGKGTRGLDRALRGGRPAGLAGKRSCPQPVGC